MKTIEFLHQGEKFEAIVFCTAEFDCVDQIPHLNTLASLQFLKDGDCVGDVIVLNNKILSYAIFNSLGWDLADSALEYLEKTDIDAWEKCNWNFAEK